jgi:hypothetical protein
LTAWAKMSPTIRITLDMYLGATAGTFDRARTATQ